MKATTRINKSELFKLAWQFVKRNGMSMSSALATAWRNLKLKAKMQTGIVKFYFQKVDGTAREAYGTLCDRFIPMVQAAENKKKNDTVQVYYDTERGAFRSFKKANVLNIA